MSTLSSKQLLTGFKQHAPITTSDTVNLAQLMYIYCLTSGTAAVVDTYDTVVSYPMTAGQLLPVLAKRVNSTGTTGSYAGIF